MSMAWDKEVKSVSPILSFQTAAIRSCKQLQQRSKVELHGFQWIFNIQPQSSDPTLQGHLQFAIVS